MTTISTRELGLFGAAGVRRWARRDRRRNAAAAPRRLCLDAPDLMVGVALFVNNHTHIYSRTKADVQDLFRGWLPGGALAQRGSWGRPRGHCAGNDARRDFFSGSASMGSGWAASMWTLGRYGANENMNSLGNWTPVAGGPASRARRLRSLTPVRGVFSGPRHKAFKYSVLLYIEWAA